MERIYGKELKEKQNKNNYYDDEMKEKMKIELNKINMCKQPLECYKKFVKIVNENIPTQKYRDCPSEHIKRMYEY